MIVFDWKFLRRNTKFGLNSFWTVFLFSIFLFLNRYLTLWIVCAQVEKLLLFVFSKRIGTIGFFFVYYLLSFSLYQNFIPENTRTKYLDPVVFSVYGMYYRLPNDIFLNFSTARPMKIVIILISGQKIQHFSKTCLLISSFTHWYHLELIQIQFFERTPRLLNF